VLTKLAAQPCPNPGLHNSEISKGQSDRHTVHSRRAAKVYFIVQWSGKHSATTINYTRSQAFATFSAIEKALTGHNKSSRGPYVVQACPNCSFETQPVTFYA